MLIFLTISGEKILTWACGMENEGVEAVEAVGSLNASENKLAIYSIACNKT